MGLLITRILQTVAGIAFIVLAFVFASLVVAIVLAVGLIAWAWLAWRGRGRVVVVRREGSRVIEGEYRIIDQR